MLKKIQFLLWIPKELKEKAQLIADQVYAKDAIENQTEEIGSLEAIGLSWHVIDQYIPNIEAVTPQQIQIVAKKYLTKDRLTIGILQPIKLGS